MLQNGVTSSLPFHRTLSMHVLLDMSSASDCQFLWCNIHMFLHVSKVCYRSSVTVPSKMQWDCITRMHIGPEQDHCMSTTIVTVCYNCAGRIWQNKCYHFRCNHWYADQTRYKCCAQHNGRVANYCHVPLVIRRVHITSTSSYPPPGTKW